jgi:hypothetical protein
MDLLLCDFQLRIMKLLPLPWSRAVSSLDTASHFSSLDWRTWVSDTALCPAPPAFFPDLTGFFFVYRKK